MKRRVSNETGTDSVVEEEIVEEIVVPKGTFIHVPIEGFQLDKELWGEDAWQYMYVCLLLIMLAGC